MLYKKLRGVGKPPSRCEHPLPVGTRSQGSCGPAVPSIPFDMVSPLLLQGGGNLSSSPQGCDGPVLRPGPVQTQSRFTVGRFRPRITDQPIKARSSIKFKE